MSEASEEVRLLGGYALRLRDLIAAESEVVKLLDRLAGAGQAEAVAEVWSYFDPGSTVELLRAIDRLRRALEGKR